ncbi:MAG TPA: ATP-binding protein [Thermoanaerobaculia bacterium]|nr:ATP-binding protein [Thermoanaerobaculia bacterium]
MSSQVPADVATIDFATLELLPYGIIVLDGDGTILYYNAREEQITTRRREDVLGRNFFTEVAPCTKVATFYGQFRDTMASEGTTAEFKFTFPFPDRPRDVEIALTGFRYYEQLLCLVSVRDVTEEEDVRDRILTAERFREVGEVASGVAHNFNNILMAIGMWAKLVRRQLGPEAPAQRGIDQIIKAVDDATSMVRRIADTTRQTPTAGTTDDCIEINSVVQEALDQVTGRIEECQRKITPQGFLDETNPCVRGYGSELREVLVNLLGNAIDATENDGSVSVTTRTVDDQVRVDVTDTGTGMSEETQKKLFRPLFSTKGLAGTGLGLSTSYAIVRRHRGEIRVKSSQGKGSTFSVILPQVPRQ